MSLIMVSCLTSYTFSSLVLSNHKKAKVQRLNTQILMAILETKLNIYLELRPFLFLSLAASPSSRYSITVGFLCSINTTPHLALTS